MNQAMRNAIVERRQAGTSVRGIARTLGIARQSVQRVLDQVAAERAGQTQASDLPPTAKRRPSQLDAYEPVLRELFAHYPDMTAMRLFEELRGRGFAGKYTIVRQRVELLRPRPIAEPVLRFETAPAQQAQMDYGVYDVNFTQEGRRRVYLFNYLLGYSRRAYMRFVDAQDFTTTIREHVRAFTYLEGVAATCLYDNQKVVVLRHDDEGPIYNPRFLAFATHYGFKPWACKPRRPQTKGKIERRFHFAEVSLLNGRTFHTLDHLNEVTLTWLANVADLRVHAETKQTPLQRYAVEQAHLIALPAQAYDTALVLYRSVNAKGFIAYRQNFYAAPWCYIGQLVPVRITEHEVVVYSPAVEEVARHALMPRTRTGQRQVGASHPARADANERFAVLAERFQALGPAASASSTVCWPSSVRANSRPSTSWRCWPITTARTGWPPWSGRFASRLFPGRRGTHPGRHRPTQEHPGLPGRTGTPAPRTAPARRSRGSATHGRLPTLTYTGDLKRWPAADQPHRQRRRARRRRLLTTCVSASWPTSRCCACPWPPTTSTPP